MLDWLLTDADGLIISDVGGRAPGFGAAAEATVYASQFGPVLDVREAGCSVHSTVQDALDPALGARVEPEVAFDDGMAECCAAWLTESFEDVLAAHRRRLNERVLNHGLHQMVVKLVREAPGEVIEHALHRSGLTLDKLLKMVDHVDHLSDVTRHQIDALYRTMSASSRVRIPLAPAQIDIPALLKAGEIRKWSVNHMRYLMVQAQDELRLTNAEHRLPLMTPNDWIMLDERL
jgi:hypothetical protein